MKDLNVLNDKLDAAIKEFALRTRETFPEGSTTPVCEADMAQLSRLMVYTLILRPAVIDRRAFVGNARKLLPRTYITVIIGKSGIFDLAHTLFESLDLFFKQLDSLAFLHSLTSLSLLWNDS